MRSEPVPDASKPCGRGATGVEMLSSELVCSPLAGSIRHRKGSVRETCC